MSENKPEPKLCACGCGESFTPTRPWHKYIDENHRWNAWRKRNLEARAGAASADRIRKRIRKLVAIDGPITAAEMKQRLEKIDKYLNGRTMKKTKS